MAGQCLTCEETEWTGSCQYWSGSCSDSLDYCMLQCSGPDIPFTITLKYEGGGFVPGNVEGGRGREREGGGGREGWRERRREGEKERGRKRGGEGGREGGGRERGREGGREGEVHVHLHRCVVYVDYIIM